MAWATREVGTISNQAAQRGIRLGWYACLVHLALVFLWGGFYQPAWNDGGMLKGAVFAGLTMVTPLVMAVTAIVTYRRHHKRLTRQLVKEGKIVCRIWADDGEHVPEARPGGCVYCA